MTMVEVLTEIEKLTLAERIAIIEETLRLIRRDVTGDTIVKSAPEKKMSLAEAATLLLNDYNSNRELIALTALDSEDFYAA